MAALSQRSLRRLVPDALDELGDWWAIAVAEIAAFAAYDFGYPLLVAAAVGLAVLAVRVAAGLRLRARKRRRRPREREVHDHRVEELLNTGKSVQETARALTVTEGYVTKIQQQMQRPAAPVTGRTTTTRHWYEHPLVRGTVTAGGFLTIARWLYEGVSRAAQ